MEENQKIILEIRTHKEQGDSLGGGAGDTVTTVSISGVSLPLMAKASPGEWANLMDLGGSLRRMESLSRFIEELSKRDSQPKSEEARVCEIMRLLSGEGFSAQRRILTACMALADCLEPSPRQRS